MMQNLKEECKILNSAVKFKYRGQKFKWWISNSNHEFWRGSYAIKPTFPNSNLTRNVVDEEPICGYATSKKLFIYPFICLIPIIFFSNIITMRAHSWNFPASLTRHILQYIKCYNSFPFYGYMACDAFSLLENEN